MITKTREITIPFHRAAVGEDEVQAITEVIRSGWLTMGARTFEFEHAFADYVGAKHAVAVSSCTAALHLSLEAVDVGPQDEVLVPTTTFTATAEVVTYFGARPVLVDIDPQTLNIDSADARRKITPRTRAIIPVHFAGQPCDLAAIHELAADNDLHVIEDAAHALPSEYRGQRVGSISELTTFSFYATKTLTTGEGGMITTDNESYSERLKVMRLHGIAHDAWNRYGAEGSWYYEVLETGYKYNLTDLQAAIGIVQLAKCDAMYEARRRISDVYTKAFRSSWALRVPLTAADRQTSWHLYVLRLVPEQLRIDRNQFIDELAERGVAASVHFIPLHLQPAYQRRYGYSRGDCPIAEREYRRCVSLPIYPTMSEEDVERVVWAVLDVVATFSK